MEYAGRRDVLDYLEAHGTGKENKFEENSTRKYLLCVSTANRSGLFTETERQKIYSWMLTWNQDCRPWCQQQIHLQQLVAQLLWQ